MEKKIRKEERGGKRERLPAAADSRARERGGERGFPPFFVARWLRFSSSVFSHFFFRFSFFRNKLLRFAHADQELAILRSLRGSPSPPLPQRAWESGRSEPARDQRTTSLFLRLAASAKRHRSKALKSRRGKEEMAALAKYKLVRGIRIAGSPKRRTTLRPLALERGTESRGWGERRR